MLAVCSPITPPDDNTNLLQDEVCRKQVIPVYFWLPCPFKSKRFWNKRKSQVHENIQTQTFINFNPLNGEILRLR